MVAESVQSDERPSLVSHRERRRACGGRATHR
jgi:hypothetical protein